MGHCCSSADPNTGKGDKTSGSGPLSATDVSNF